MPFLCGINPMQRIPAPRYRFFQIAPGLSIVEDNRANHLLVPVVRLLPFMIAPGRVRYRVDSPSIIVRSNRAIKGWRIET